MGADPAVSDASGNTSYHLAVLKKDSKAGIGNKIGNRKNIGYGNKEICERLLPMLLELKTKQAAMREEISNNSQSKDSLIPDRK